MVRERERDIMGTYSSSRGCGGGDMNEKPAWLERLMAETFFGACGVHQDRRKNEKNVFCLHCCLSICPHCLSSHRSHPLLQLSFLSISPSKGFSAVPFIESEKFDPLVPNSCCVSLLNNLHRKSPIMRGSNTMPQVRRYVYHDVIRLDDLEKLIDCSNIQPYTINSAKVIFLNQRPQSRTCKGPANACFTCDRILQEPFHFCSLSCKFEGLRVDGSEVTDEDTQIAPSSSYSNTEATSNSVISCEPNNNVKKGKGNNTFLPGIVLSLGSRRKGAPHRAPLS
ncbi:hypothetical protein V8G54_005466 [Vigna mungo]|uniref:PLATZ transcription factor family protein n=1 Tax=Vigna mungo TaxID=3915 RepID=A0AAQ3S3S3_VIGMU